MEEDESEEILRLLEGKDHVIEELQEEKMVLMEELEKALLELEATKEKARQPGEGSGALEVVHPRSDTLNDQWSALQHQLDGLKNDVMDVVQREAEGPSTTAARAMFLEQELQTQDFHARNMHQFMLEATPRPPHGLIDGRRHVHDAMRSHASELEQRLQRMFNVNMDLMQQLASVRGAATAGTAILPRTAHSRTLEEGSQTDPPPRYSNTSTQTFTVSSQASQPLAVDVGVQWSANGLELVPSGLSDSRHAAMASGPSLDWETAYQECKRQMESVSALWQEAQADHAIQLDANDVHVASLKVPFLLWSSWLSTRMSFAKDQVADTARQLSTSQTECMTLLSTLQCCTEKLEDVEVRYANAVGMQAEDCATRVLEWAMRYDHVWREKQEVIHHATLVIQAAETEEQAVQPWIHVSNEERGARHRLENALADATARCAELEADVACEMRQSRADRELRRDVEAALDDMKALHQADGAVKQQLEKRLAFVLQGAALALEARDGATTDWPALLTQLAIVASSRKENDKRGSATVYSQRMREKGPLDDDARHVASSVSTRQTSNRRSSSPTRRVREVEESGGEEPAYKYDKEHMCLWHRQAKLWEAKLQRLELEHATTEDALVEMTDAKAASDADVAALKAAQVAWRKKVVAAQAHVDGAKAAMAKTTDDLARANRERQEMEHMIARLRDECTRLKDSLRRKQEIIAHHKRSVEAQQVEFDDHVRKIKAEAQMQQQLLRPSAAARITQESNSGRWQQQAQELQAQVSRLKTDKEHLASRCATLQHAVLLKDRLMKEQTLVLNASTTSDDVGGNGEEGTAVSSDQVKELKRRIGQKQSVIDALKAKESLRETEWTRLIEKYDRLQGKLKAATTMAHAADASVTSAREQLDGLRACVYDVAHHLLFPTATQGHGGRRATREVDLLAANMQAVTSLAFSPSELEAVMTKQIDQDERHRVILELEQALEDTPADCRQALLDALHASPSLPP
ncbi:Aste57867_21744 [Aphanomyces stellatus]|uniref:Aste57867_21744 protein n=1 Tax=Aphanomyces stellatus TaxID=120398 RepID=A0A485LIC7_9STRA|nr:hypothetical protein As57867_021675 [Aphanomyces stellatus]VFT98413.1 Aste57867_21744 [Aphanomyces stellatus]